MIMSSRSFNQRGFTLIEMLVVVIIGLTILMAALRLIPPTENSRKANDLVSEVVLIKQNMKKLFPDGSELYNAYNAAPGGLMGVLTPMMPPDLRGTAGSAFGVFGTPIEGVSIRVMASVWPTSGTPVMGDAYVIAIQGMPSDECFGVVRSLVTVSDMVQVRNKIVYKTPDKSFDATETATACNQSGATVPIFLRNT